MDTANRNLHSALRTELVAEASGGGVIFKQMKLTHSRNDISFSVHARPGEWSTAGIQTTDILALIGFRRQPCPFFNMECYARAVNESFSVADFSTDFNQARNALRESEQHLDKCSVSIPSPEGIGFFHGKPSSPTARRGRALWSTGDGHNAANVRKLKESEDKYFSFILTFGEFQTTKGWVFHYKPKNPPLTPEMQAALRFIGNSNTFPECPEFDFEPCAWRFLLYEEHEDDLFNRLANFVHDAFDAHAEHFSVGIEKLLNAHSFLNRHNLSFLRLDSASPAQISIQTTFSPTTKGVVQVAKPDSTLPDQFDVALSFAGTEREHAETLATIVRDAGYAVFYDNFYEEHLWGKDLYVFFDEIYRKRSRFCVMFVSEQYRDRMWTNHERRSAQARVLERGEGYILPIQVENIELPGLRPTVGYVRLSPQRSIENIAQVLIRKLQLENQS